MPVYKYKSLDEAEKDMVNLSPDHLYFEQSEILWNTVDTLCPISCKKGVFKFKSIEEANQQREEWEIETAIALRKNRENMAADL